MNVAQDSFPEARPGRAVCVMDENNIVAEYFTNIAQGYKDYGFVILHDIKNNTYNIFYFTIKFYIIIDKFIC